MTTSLDSNQPLVAKTGSRSLSAITNQANATVLEYYLVFENINENVTILKQNLLSEDTSWTDISSTFFSSTPNSTFGVPFATCFQPHGNSIASASVFGSNVTLAFAFFDPRASREQNFIWANYNVTNAHLEIGTHFSIFRKRSLTVAIGTTAFAPTNYTPPPPLGAQGTYGLSSPLDPALVQRSDLVLTRADTTVEGYWINGTTPSLYTMDGKDADPFPRMGTLVSNNGSVPLYLYHQINGSLFSELYYDTLTASWSVTNVDVTKLNNNSAALNTGT